MLRSVAWVGMTMVVAACFGDERTSFPSGLEPLEENRAAPPTSPDEPWPEAISFARGSDDWYWVHARAYVHAPIADTWRALRDGHVVVDDARVDSWSIRWSPQEDYDYGFVIHNVAHDIVTVEFDVTWRQGAVEGTRDDPVVVAARFQKTNGTPFIELMRGSIVLRPVAEGVVELAMVEHLKAAAGGTEELEAYQRNVFEDTLDFVH